MKFDRDKDYTAVDMENGSFICASFITCKTCSYKTDLCEDRVFVYDNLEGNKECVNISELLSNRYFWF